MLCLHSIQEDVKPFAPVRAFEAARRESKRSAACYAPKPPASFAHAPHRSRGNKPGVFVSVD